MKGSRGLGEEEERGGGRLGKAKRREGSWAPFLDLGLVLVKGSTGRALSSAQPLPPTVSPHPLEGTP